LSLGKRKGGKKRTTKRPWPKMGVKKTGRTEESKELVLISKKQKAEATVCLWFKKSAVFTTRGRAMTERAGAEAEGR